MFEKVVDVWQTMVARMWVGLYKLVLKGSEYDHTTPQHKALVKEYESSIGFVECDTCAAKTGTPLLCGDCIARRVEFNLKHNPHNRPKQYEPDGQIGDIDNPLDAPVADGIFELDVPMEQLSDKQDAWHYPKPHTDHPVGNPFYNDHGGWVWVMEIIPGIFEEIAREAGAQVFRIDKYRNKGNNCGGAISLGEFDDPAYQALAFFHELGHVLNNRRRDKLGLKKLCVVSDEGAAWETGLCFAAEHGYYWDDEQLNKAKIALQTYKCRETFWGIEKERGSEL